MHLPAVRYALEGRNRLTIEIPERSLPLVKELLTKAAAGYLQVELRKPGRPRTTGPGSQSHHINGHVQQIAVETGNDFEDVKEAAKLRAMKRGYPADTMPNGWLVPRSETQLTTEEAGHLIEELHQIAAELQINLQEGQ